MDKIIKICILFGLYISSLHAINIVLEKDHNLSVKSSEIDTMQRLLESQNVRLKKDDLKMMIADDRTLANAYLDRESIAEDVMNEFRFSIEKKLSELYIEECKKNLKLDDNILKSYYIDHHDEFSHKIMVNVEFLHTDSFDEAYKLYDKNKEIPKNIYEYAKDENITYSKYTIQLENLNDSIKRNMRVVEEENYLLPPLYFTDHFTVVYIKNIKMNVKLPYDKGMKGKIRKFLIEKNANNLRIQLLKKLNNAQ